MSPNERKKSMAKKSKQVAELRDSKIVHLLCRFLAITTMNEVKLTPRYKIYAAFIILVNICGFLHSAYGRYSKFLSKLELPFIVTDTLSNFLLTSLIAMNSLFGIFIYSKEITKLRSLIQSFPILGTSDSWRFHADKRYFIIFNSGTLLLLMCDAINWTTSLSYEIFMYYAWRHVQVYHASIIIFVMIYVGRELEYRLRTINTCLKDNILRKRQNEKKEIYSLTGTGTPVTNNSRLIKELSLKYGVIYESVQVYNDIFGLLIILDLCLSVTYILNSIYVMLVYNKAAVFANIHEPNLIALCLLWITVALVMPTLIAASCNGAAKEAEKTATICFALLNELPTIPKTENDRIIREELILLSHQATARCPKFSAAGFFNVDYSILGFILGTVTTYVIVILQFHGQ